MKGKEYKATIRTYDIRRSTRIERNHKSHIKIINASGSTVTINGTALNLWTGGQPAFEFRTDKDAYIDMDFDIAFKYPSSSDRLLVIETYFTKL